MALSINTCWEVRQATGSDSSGGGFVAGASGTDYSQQDSAQISLTDLSTTGVTTTLTSVTGGFTSAMIGNIIQITAGTNFTVGFYEIKTRVDTNTITVDRAPTSAAGVSGVGAVGGALATINTLATAMIASNKAYLKGAFTSTATITFSQSVTPSNTTLPSRLIGYTTTRGDGGSATLTLSTNTGLTALSMAGNGWIVEGLFADCASLGTSIGISLTGNYSIARKCKVANFTSKGVSSTISGNTVEDCEVTGGTSAASSAISVTSNGAFILRNFVHDNACPGISLVSYSIAAFNLVANNSGASSDGISVAYGSIVINNIIHGNGRDGIRHTDIYTIDNIRTGNIITNNAGYGLNNNSGAMPADVDSDGNAYFSNTSGSRHNADSTSGIESVNPYTNVRDVTLTSSPYQGPTTGTTANFSLNTTAGGGAACRAAGIPATWLGNTGTTSFPDMGAVQHKDPAAGSPGIIVSA